MISTRKELDALFQEIKELQNNFKIYDNTVLNFNEVAGWLKYYNTNWLTKKPKIQYLLTTTLPSEKAQQLFQNGQIKWSQAGVFLRRILEQQKPKTLRLYELKPIGTERLKDECINRTSLLANAGIFKQLQNGVDFTHWGTFFVAPGGGAPGVLLKSLDETSEFYLKLKIIILSEGQNILQEFDDVNLRTWVEEKYKLAFAENAENLVPGEYEITNREVIRTERIIDYIALIKLQPPSDKVVAPYLTFGKWAGIDCRIICNLMPATGAVVAERGQVIKKVTMVYTDDFTQIKYQMTESSLEKKQVNILFPGEQSALINVQGNQFEGDLNAILQGAENLEVDWKERQYESGNIKQKTNILGDIVITKQKKGDNNIEIKAEDKDNIDNSININLNAEQSKINGEIFGEEIKEGDVEQKDNKINLNIQTDKLAISGEGSVLSNNVAPEIRQDITIYNKENEKQINVKQNTFNMSEGEALSLGEMYAPKQAVQIVHAINEVIGTVIDKKIKQDALVMASQDDNNISLGLGKKEQVIKIQEHQEVVYIEKKNQANLILEQKNKIQREIKVEHIFEHQIVCKNENWKKQAEDTKKANIKKLEILQNKVREIQNNRLPFNYTFGNKSDKDTFDALMELFDQMFGAEYCSQYLSEYKRRFNSYNMSQITKQRRPEFLKAVRNIFQLFSDTLRTEIQKIRQVQINSADELPTITKYNITSLEVLKTLALSKVGDLVLMVEQGKTTKDVLTQEKALKKLSEKIEVTEKEQAKAKLEKEQIKTQQEKLTTDVNTLTEQIKRVHEQVSINSIAASERSFNLMDEMKAHKEDFEKQKRINEQKLEKVEKKVVNFDKLMGSFSSTLKNLQKKQEEQSKPLVITISDEDKNYLAFKGEHEKIIQPLLDKVNDAAKAIANRPKPKYYWSQQNDTGKEVLNMVLALQNLRTALNKQFGRESSSENEKMYKRKYIENVMGFVDEYTETAQGKTVTQEQRVFQKMQLRLADVFKEYSKTFPMAELGLEVLNIEFQKDINYNFHILAKTNDNQNVFLDLLPKEWKTKIEQTPTEEEVKKQSLLTKLLPSKLVTFKDSNAFVKTLDASTKASEKAAVTIPVTNYDIPEGLKYRRYKPYLTAGDHLPISHFFRVAYNIKERYMSFGNKNETTQTVIDYITKNEIFPMKQVPPEARITLTSLLARKNIKSQLSEPVQKTLQGMASGTQGILYGNIASISPNRSLQPILCVIETNVNKKVPVVEHQLRDARTIFKTHLATTPNQFVVAFGNILQKMYRLATYFTKANYVPEEYKNDQILSVIFKNDFDKTFEAAIKYSAKVEMRGFLTKTFSTIPFYAAVNPMAVGYTELPILEEGKWLLVSDETNKRAVDTIFGEGTFADLKKRFGDMTLWILTDMASKGVFDKVFSQKNLFVPDHVHITGKTYLFLADPEEEDDEVYLIVTDSYLSQTYLKKRPTTRENDQWVRATIDKLKFVGTNSPESYCCYLNERDLAYGITLGYADSTNYALWILRDDMRMFFKEQQDGYIYDKYGMRRTVKKLIENDGYYISIDNEDTVPSTAGWNGINVPAGYPRTIPINFGWYCADFINEKWFK